jgi:hypothetical protein
MSHSIEEKELIERVQRARRQIRNEYYSSLIKDSETRRAHGDAFIEGVWVPKEMSGQVRRRLFWGSLVGFLEFNVAVLLGLALLNVIWKGFERLILP